MSSSFDESSSLCVNPPSPPNGEKEESFDKKSSDEGQLSPTSSPLHHAGLSASSYSSQSHSKAKKSKGLTGLLSRAKEGAKKTKAALKHPYPKSPLKSPSKSVSKSLAKALSKSPGKSSRSKSPSLSPSTDNLTDDVSVQRCKIDENSEEWKAFQEMQERIKQTVQKTKSNLTKLASTSVADSEDGTVKPVAKPSAGSWVSFEQGEGEKDDKLTEIDIDVITNDKLDLSWAAYDESVVDAELIETEADLLHLEVTPVPSPRISPRVPSNSLRTSREDLNQTDLLSGDIPPTVNMDDLLGLGETSVTQTSDSVNTTSVPLNQDLLGLGFDTQGEDTSNTDPFSALSTTQKPKAVELLFSSVGDSAQSSQRSSPCVFDSDLLGSLGASDSPCPQSQQEVSSASQLANSLVDDFLGLGEAEQPAQPSHDIHSVFDPFKTISDDSHVIDNQATETSALAPANPFNTSNMSDQPLESSSAINPFDISTSDFLGTTETANVSTEESRTQSLNPWFSQTIEEVGDSSTDILGNREPSQKELFSDIAQSAVSDHSDSLIQSAPTHPHPTNTALITTSKPVVQAVSDFESLTSNICEETTGPQNTKETAEFTGTIVKAVQDFDDDFFGKVAPASDTVDVFDAWGLNATDTDASKNPFLDTFSTGEMNTEGFGDDANKNPFLSDDFSSFPTDTITPSNPFLGETDNTTTGTADLSAFLFESKEVCTDNSDSFDPFGVKNEEQSAPPERAAVSIFEAVSAAGDNQLVEPGEGDEEDDFAGVPMKLEIKPSSGKPLGKAPPLPPPPKTSAMPVRENPFDRDSPPEEEFAKFDVGEEAKRAERLETSMSMSTESSTPDDEEPPGPLEKYHPKFEGSGWHLMLRQPTKKKITGNRYWKNVFVKLAMAKEGPVLKLYTDEGERDSFQELPLQPCYSLSDISLQQYDQYGKIHTVKLQYIFYRERVGLRAERITPNFVRKPKPTMILDHSPQVSELLKFGSLKKDYLRTFIWEVEDALMNIEAHRDKTLSYTKDEVSVDVWDEFEAEIDKHGHITDKKSRVRIFCLAFVTGMPSCELGVNDKRRKGKEVVGRHDIIPVKTEDWIKIQDYEFHSVVEKEAFEKTNTIRFRPLDGCQFELMRFRARPKENRELPLQAKIQQTINGSHVEIRCELLVTGYHANSKKHGQFPCEDIEVHFPIPEQWIYLFRYERRFGYGSIRSAMRKPGKIKGLERLTMMAQGNLPPALLEASVGLAKYENVYRAVVWRINRLPERNEGAYKTHLFKLSMDLGPHDEMPAELEQYSDIEFTMPSSTVSKTQVRSVSVANPNPPEKWVRYVAKYQMKVEIEHCRAEEPQAAQNPDDSEDVQNDGY